MNNEELVVFLFKRHKKIADSLQGDVLNITEINQKLGRLQELTELMEFFADE